MRIRNSPSFTLVELLAVIGIMALLAVVGVPAIKGLTGSGGRKMALGQLLGAMEVARNIALNTCTNTAVIFPQKQDDGAFGGSNNPYRYRSMAVVGWDPTNSTNPATMQGSWITLPQGISFYPRSIHSLQVATNVSVRILIRNITTNFSAIVFQGDGGLSEDPVTGNFNTNISTTGVAFFEGKVLPDPFTLIWNKTSSNIESVTLTRYTGRAFATMRPTNSFP